MIDHYKILEISETASDAQIRQAYKRLAKIYHPDRNPSLHATAIFQQLAESYRVLSSPTLKATYDSIRKGGVTRVAPPRPRPPQYQRPPAPVYSQEDLIRPYLRYAYIMNRIFLVFAILLLIDYAGPQVSLKEYIADDFWVSASTGNSHRVTVHTRENTHFEIESHDTNLSIPEGWVELKKTFLFRVPRQLILSDGQVLPPVTTVYDALLFFPVLLLLFSLAANKIRGGAIVDFNLTIVSGILTFISLFILLISI